MISIQKQFLFIHVPKTGGNSLQNILRDYSEDSIVTLAPHQDGLERFEVRSPNYTVTKHSTLKHYKSVIESDLYLSLYKFATIRNPWDMMVSFYFSPHRGVNAWDRYRFIELLEQVEPLRHYVCSDESVGDLRSELDYLLRFESLQQDFEQVCRALDLPITSLPVRNSSNRDHYSSYYDEDLIERVAAKFSEEIAIGGYRYDSHDRLTSL